MPCWREFVSSPTRPFTSSRERWFSPGGRTLAKLATWADSARGTVVALPPCMSALPDTPSSGVEAPVNAGSHRQPPAPPGAPGGDRVPGQTDLLKDLRIITVLMVMRPTGRTTSWIQRALGERSRACTEGLLRAMATAGLISAKSGSRLHTTWHLAAPAIAWLESRPYGHLDP